MPEGTPQIPSAKEIVDARFDIQEFGTVPESERTPKEWREKLRGLITNAKEKLGMSGRGEHWNVDF